MTFKNIAEAFNFYKDKSVQEIEKRAAEIEQEIAKNPAADMAAFNIELDGLKQAKDNIEERSQKQQNFAPLTGIKPDGKKAEVPENVFDRKEYRSGFFKTLLGQKLNPLEAAAMKEGIAESEKRSFATTSNSAAVLPTTTLNEVISKARKMGGLIGVCRNFAMPTNISVPIGTPSSKANWHEEGAAVEGETPTTASVKFAGYEIVKIFSISAAASKMSIAAFEQYLTEELTSCVMECIADALVNGTGSAQGTGLITGVTWDKTNSLTYTKGASITYKNLTAALALLKRGYSSGAVWAMNNATMYNQVYGLVDGNNRPLFVPDPQHENDGFVLGKALVIDDNLPDGVIVLGNFQYMGYNIPEGIILEMSRESSFKSNLVDYKASAIADTKPLVSEAFVKISEATA